MSANVQAISDLVKRTTTVYRKGAEITHNGKPVEAIDLDAGGVFEVFGYEPTPEDRTGVVDMIFVDVKVTPEADTNDRLAAAIGDGVFDEYGTTMSTGPTYIHLGAELGSQELALRFMALGSSLDLFKLMTGRDLGMSEEETKELAGGGFIYAIPNS